MIDEDFLRKLGNAGKFSQLRLSVEQQTGGIRWCCTNPDGSVATGVGQDLPSALRDLQESLTRVTGRLQDYHFGRPRLESKNVETGRGLGGTGSLEQDIMDMLG